MGALESVTSCAGKSNDIPCNKCLASDKEAITPEKPEKEEDDADAALKPGEDPTKKIKFLKKVPLFADLKDDMLKQVLMKAKEVRFQGGDAIITEGEEGNDFFVIIRGKANVVAGGKQVASLTTGDYFGEGALLTSEPRKATIKAVDSVLSIKLSRDAWNALMTKFGTNFSLNFDKRKKGKKNQQDVAKKIKFLKKVPLFKTLTDLMLNSVLDVAYDKKYDDGEDIIVQGEEGSDLYVIIKGEAKVLVDTNEVAKLTVGDYFGEKGLLNNEVRSATVKAAGAEVRILGVERSQFVFLGLHEHLSTDKLVQRSNGTLTKEEEEKVKKKKKFLAKVPLFSGLPDEKLTKVLEIGIEHKFEPNANIIVQGDDGDNMFVILKGSATVHVDDAKVADKGVGEYFGEKALLNNDVRSATVKAVDKVIALSIERSQYALLGLKVSE